MRWDNLNTEERQQMTAMAGNLLQESAKPNEPWVLKSQVAALMAEVSYSLNMVTSATVNLQGLHKFQSN